MQCFSFFFFFEKDKKDIGATGGTKKSEKGSDSSKKSHPGPKHPPGKSAKPHTQHGKPKKQQSLMPGTGNGSSQDKVYSPSDKVNQDYNHLRSLFHSQHMVDLPFTLIAFSYCCCMSYQTIKSADCISTSASPRVQVLITTVHSP